MKNHMYEEFEEFLKDEYKFDLSISEFFSNPKGMAWACFMRGYQAAEQSMHQTAFGVMAVVFFLGSMVGAIAINAVCGGW